MPLGKDNEVPWPTIVAMLIIVGCAHQKNRILY